MKISYLETLKQDITIAINNHSKFEGEKKDTVADRNKVYDKLNHLTSMIISVLKSSGVEKDKVEIAKSIHRKINGSNVKARTENVTAEDGTVSKVPIPNTSSNSQQSFDNRADFLNDLINFVALQSAYKPNENYLKIAGLKDYHKELIEENEKRELDEVLLSNMKYQRDVLLYHPEQGLYRISVNIKEYVKGIYGAKSHNYKEIAKIKFTNARFTPNLPIN